MRVRPSVRRPGRVLGELRAGLQPCPCRLPPRGSHSPFPGRAPEAPLSQRAGLPARRAVPDAGGARAAARPLLRRPRGAQSRARTAAERAPAAAAPPAGEARRGAAPDPPRPGPGAAAAARGRAGEKEEEERRQPWCRPRCGPARSRSSPPWAPGRPRGRRRTPPPRPRHCPGCSRRSFTGRAPSSSCWSTRRSSAPTGERRGRAGPGPPPAGAGAALPGGARLSLPGREAVPLLFPFPLAWPTGDRAARIPGRQLVGNVLAAGPVCPVLDRACAQYVPVLQHRPTADTVPTALGFSSGAFRYSQGIAPPQTPVREAAYPLTAPAEQCLPSRIFLFWGSQKWRVNLVKWLNRRHTERVRLWLDDANSHMESRW